MKANIDNRAEETSHFKKKKERGLYYRLDVPVLIIKKEHRVKGDPSPRMNSLKMICFVCPTRKYFLNQEEEFGQRIINMMATMHGLHFIAISL